MLRATLYTDMFFGKVRHEWILANESTFVALRKRAQNLTSFDDNISGTELKVPCRFSFIYLYDP